MLLPIIPAADFSLSGFFETIFSPQLEQTVRQIISQVRSQGDLALKQYTKEFDQVELGKLRVPESDIQEAGKNISLELRFVFEQALERIKHFHSYDMASSWTQKQEDGSILGQKVTPLDRVGIYIPGGKAVYPSTVFMNVVPARLAGVPSIALVSPPTENGLPHTMVLAACALSGIKEVYSIGGAQSIAALAYGTESIDPVCKITGPGNQYVAEAKRQVYGKVSIDSIAGPSEIVILHDDPSISSDYLLRDMLSQAEHDEEAKSILITTSQETALMVQKRAEEIVPGLPRRKIIETSFKNHGKIIVVETVKEGVELVNRIAPEHLEILSVKENIIDLVRNAGSIFCGKWSTEVIGDYFAGPNHTIPTNGKASFSSPLSTRDFQKCSSLIQYSEEAFKAQAASIIRFAEIEEFSAHADAIRVRLED